MNNSTALQLKNVVRSFHQGDVVLEILRGVSLEIQPGEIVALVGPSGAGKSTLLQICGLLEAPTSGSVQIGGVEASQASDEERTALRREHLGFVYQYHHLLPEFSASENIIVPQMIAGVSRRDAKIRAMELLEPMGLADRSDHRPGQLSGGEQQRVAIARALANRPRLLLADEPTGNLDPHTANQVFEVLLSQVRREGLSAFLATHNPDLAKRMDRVLTIVNGIVVPYEG